MDKAVVILEREAQNPELLAEEIKALPGVSVTSSSKSFIDLNVEEGAGPRLKEFANSRGLTVSNVEQAELIEPIDPWRSM